MSRFLTIFDYSYTSSYLFSGEAKVFLDTFSCFFFAYICFLFTYHHHIPMKNGWTYYDCFVRYTCRTFLPSHLHYFNTISGILHDDPNEPREDSE
jgi:hypothetical protein